MKVPIDAGEYYPVTERRGTGTRFRPHTLPAADDAAFVRAGLHSVSAAYDVEVLIQAPAAAVRQQIGQRAAVEDIDAHSMRAGPAAAGHPALRRAAGLGGPGAGWSWERFAARVNPGAEAGINPESHPWADAADGWLEAL